MTMDYDNYLLFLFGFLLPLSSAVEGKLLLSRNAHQPKLESGRQVTGHTIDAGLHELRFGPYSSIVSVFRKGNVSTGSRSQSVSQDANPSLLKRHIVNFELFYFSERYNDVWATHRLVF